jgi:spermidine synthase
MTPELMRDADRPDGWWLIVGGSEQSFVDTADPLHLEFEYVQMVAHVVETVFATKDPIDVLHLGGGLCTIPRWIAARHPGSQQRVVERSREIAGLAKRLGLPTGVRVRVADAATVLTRARGARLDLVVCDVYEGPETVTSLFTAGMLATARRLLRPDGTYVCNLSDAAPFTLSRVVGASLRELFGSVVMLAEPAVLRGRRSGNVVFGATDRAVPVADLTRRAAGGLVRVRVVAGGDLDGFVGDAVPAVAEADVPRSGESGNRQFA